MAFPRRRDGLGDPLGQALWKKHFICLPLTIAKSWNAQTGDEIWKVHLYQTPRWRIETGSKLNIPLSWVVGFWVSPLRKEIREYLPCIDLFWRSLYMRSPRGMNVFFFTIIFRFVCYFALLPITFFFSVLVTYTILYLC